MTRLYVGGLGGSTNEDDLRRFFRGFGRINDVSLKRTFAFVEFDDSRDADDAVHDLDGRRLNGMTISLEKARHPPKGRDLDRARDRNYDRDRRYSSPDDRDRDRRRYSPPSHRRRSSPVGHRNPPIRTRHQLVVKNLATRTNWRDLKELMSKYGEVVYADVDPKHNCEGLVCFSTRSDMQRALKELQGYELLGSDIRLIDEGADEDRRSDSRSPARRRRRSRSLSRSRSRSRGSSRGGRSPVHRRRSRSRSRSSRRSTGSPRTNLSPDKTTLSQETTLIKRESPLPSAAVDKPSSGPEDDSPPRPTSETKSDDMKHSTSTASPTSPDSA